MIVFDVKIKIYKFNFLYLDYIDVLILKINFKKEKIYYFNIFLNEKYFKKSSLPHSQVGIKRAKNLKSSFKYLYA